MTDTEKKAIEEMAHDLCGRCQDGICVVDGKPCNLDLDCTCQINATTLYNAGYRKQREGEWRPYKTPLDARQTGWICSNCSSVVYDLSNGDTDFCPYCGAKMKGGE